VWDPVVKAGGMAHIVLPDSTAGAGAATSKFADVAVPHLLREMGRTGAVQHRLVVKIAGGAHMASLRNGNSAAFMIGERNAEATRHIAASVGMRLLGEDTGGTHGRTVRLYVGNGRTTVTLAGQASREL
jgi:chemotaxis protein CheD